jgi:hypothetical protein
MFKGVVTGVLVLTAASVALAEAPTKSPRPMPRPVMVALATAETVGIVSPDPESVSLGMTLRPKMRPSTLVLGVEPAMPSVAMAAAVAPPEKKGLFGLLRPSKRPDRLVDKQLVAATVAPVTPGKQGVVSQKGAVCGDPSIRGETMAPITSRVQGCGLANPVRVTSVAGVRLSQAATLDCDTARALKTWVERGVEPVYGKGKVVQLQVAGHYVCRPRNHRGGAKISEHGRGRAIDISGFTFSNGKTVPVLRNFDSNMRKAHKAACGIFKTTLGPGSDGMHEDHLHFDVAQRNSTYCR